MRHGPVALDESLAEASFAAKTPLGAAHLAAVALVVVAEQMQQAVERQDPELGELRVARLARLAPRHAAGDHDLPQKTIRHNGPKGTIESFPLCPSCPSCPLC